MEITFTRMWQCLQVVYTHSKQSKTCILILMLPAMLTLQIKCLHQNIININLNHVSQILNEKVKSFVRFFVNTTCLNWLKCAGLVKNSGKYVQKKAIVNHENGVVCKTSFTKRDASQKHRLGGNTKLYDVKHTVKIRKSGTCSKV